MDGSAVYKVSIEIVESTGRNEMHKRVLITGCGRSGTIYTSTLLNQCGLDVSHEVTMGKDGISSWLFGAESSMVPWGPSPVEYSFEHKFHLVRDPLLSIPSIATFKRTAWEYISGYVPFESSDSPILRSAKYWLHWNEMVEKKTDLRLKIEDMPGGIEILCDRLGAKIDISKIKRIPRDLNTRRYGMLFNLFETECLDLGLVRHNAFLKRLLSRLPPMYAPITWDDLRAQAPSLSERIYIKALEYGYEYGSSSARIRH